MGWNTLHIRNNSEGSYLHFSGAHRDIGATLAELIKDQDFAGQVHEVLEAPDPEGTTLIVKPPLHTETIGQLATICIKYDPPITVFNL